MSSIFFKKDNRLWAIVCLSAALLIITALAACKSSLKTDKEIAAAKIDSEKIAEQKEPEIVDAGQVYFKVNLTKNDQPFINYEGDYPLGAKYDSVFTLQLCASRHIMDVSNMLNINIYMKGIATGNFPLIANGMQGKATMRMSTVKDGSYGISFQLKEGDVSISKYTDSLISGNFQANGMDHDKNKISLHGLFLNVKYHDVSHKQKVSKKL